MKTTVQQLVHFGRQQQKIIGAHAQLIGTGCTDEEYGEAQRKSDEAVALIKYAIQHLDNAHFATVLAKSAGMPGYIHFRDAVIRN